MMEVLASSETSVLTRATWRNFLEDAILQSHRRENLKSCKWISSLYLSPSERERLWMKNVYFGNSDQWCDVMCLGICWVTCLVPHLVRNVSFCHHIQSCAAYPSISIFVPVLEVMCQYINSALVRILQHPEFLCQSLNNFIVMDIYLFFVFWLTLSLSIYTGN
jgi:hypothetical protein